MLTTGTVRSEGTIMKVSTCVDHYVTYRQSLGIGFVGEKIRLKAFARSVGDIHLRAVNPRAVRRYLDGRGPITNGWLYRYHVLNGFYRFAIGRKYVSASPLPREKPRRQRSFVPYIYSVAEMESLLQAADQRYRNCWLLSPATIRTLLLLLYGSGLRISEALKLNVDDVDLHNRILTVRQTKFYKSRLVPIGRDLHDVLLAYRRKHRVGVITTADGPFLTDRKGRRIAKQTAQHSYRLVREHVGLRRPAGCAFQPRLHDLRHTFAVNRVISWYRSGKNVQQLLPHLATYLGHCSIQETQVYLQLTSELAQEASVRFFQYALPTAGQ
jgi:integrase/recombinase XerD